MQHRRKAPTNRPLQGETIRNRKKANSKNSQWDEVSVSRKIKSNYKRREQKTRVNETQGWTTFKKVGVGALALLLVFLIGATGVLAHYLTRFTREVQSAAFEPDQVSIATDFDFQFNETGFFNILLLGVTKREGREDLGSRANTIMIASLNRETGEVRLVSVYRDTLLELEGGSLDLAAHSYAYGGSRGTVAMVNRNLDLNIQHYVTVDFAALALTVNALGGVEIDVMYEERSHINGLAHQMVLEEEFAPGANLSLPPLVVNGGVQLLCGVQALAYTRIRMVGNNDFQRTERQRDVIEQMAYQASSVGLGTINEIVEIAFEYLATNFSVGEVLGHARNIGHYHIGETTGFPFNMAMKDLERTGSTIVPATLEMNVAKLHEFLFGTNNFNPSPIVRNISTNIANVSGATMYSDGGDPWETNGFEEEQFYYPEDNGNNDVGTDGNYDDLEEPTQEVPWEDPSNVTEPPDVDL
jgi:LCP family protein required for cell wall assembly